MTQYEIGYTPSNLKKLLEDKQISQKQAYEYLGKSRPAFERYLHASNDPRHTTMKHQDWLKLLDFNS